MEKLDGMSKDIVKENVEKLKELFPSIVKENKIDFEELELLLGENINRASEQYSFTWNGKTEATKLAQKRSTGTLRPCKEDSVGRNGEKGVWDNETQNLYIEGDNLEVLKLLQTSYNGKIKMIYIDPPYNTGHDFVYKDNFEDNLKNYKEITGQAQKSNAESDGRYHTNWLNMMYPRLKLARNLLTDDGVIFISIDDNEVTNLRKLCEEVFGDNNFIGQITVKSNPGGRDYGGLAQTHDYLLAFSKTSEYEMNAVAEVDKEFKYKDELGGFSLMELRNRNIKFNDKNRPNLRYPFYINTNNIDENGLYEISLDNKPGWIELFPQESQGVKTVWRWGKEKSLLNLNKDIKAKKKQDGGFMIVQKYRSTLKRERTIWDETSIRNEAGNLLIKEIFQNKKPFDYPKSLDLIKRGIVLGSENDSIVLDFFSGSATTAHAVMQLNAEDGGNRKFICVQLPEQTEETSEAFKAGYKNICEIGKERIRRAGQKIVEAQAHLNNAFKETKLEPMKAYAEFTTSEKALAEQENVKKHLDIGFKVLKLDTSNLVKWNNEPTSDIEEVERRIQESMDYLQEGRTALDLVYEIILKYGLDPTAPVTETANQKAHIIDGGDYKFLISSEPNLTLEDIETFANEPVGTYLFADRCFSDDNLLINAEEILKSKNKEMRVF